MFMRRACVVSLLLVSCFDGGDADGLPCSADAECGNEKCIDGFCGGATSSGSTTPSTSDSESLTTTMTPTTTTPTTTADTSTTEDESSSSSTGEPFMCPPPPPDPAICRGGRPIAKPTPSSQVITTNAGPIFSVIAGDFVGDEQVDIAVLADDDSTHLIENDDGDMWDVVDVSFNPGEMQLVDPYDFAFGDLACDGGSVFVYAGQGDFLA